MVLRHQQDVLCLRQLHKPPTNQRTTRQVERCNRLLASEPLDRLVLRRAAQRAQVVGSQGKPLGRWCDQLYRLALVQDKMGAQDFVASHDAVQRGLQGVAIQLAAQA
ncbi:hypothetical protein ALO86_200047 [Pseudomonas syringae pv. berberidis]|nr:hypothetical protein ALO86_200047 [Pseudomonas syringae pv. berberidis]